MATPFAPYRQTMPLLRYNTEDDVHVLDAAPTCRLRHLPATGHLLGKLRLSARHDRGWTFPRQVAEALEAVEEVPLPARCGFRAVPGGVAVEVVARADTPSVRWAIERSLEEQGVPVRALFVAADRRQLRSPLPWRCDLREAVFSPGAEQRVAGRTDTSPAQDVSQSDTTEMLQDVVRRAFDGGAVSPHPACTGLREA